MIDPSAKDPKLFRRFRGSRLSAGSRRWLGLGLGVALLAAAPSVRAQSPAASDSAERAAELFQQGNALYDQKRYADAEGLYESAWKLSKSFDLAANLGNVELLLDQPRDAAEHLAYALKNLPLGATAEKRDFIRKRLDEARARVGAITVRVNVAGADVLVDGTVVGKSPLAGEVFVDPGKHAFEARLADHDGQPVSQEAAAGSVAQVSIELSPRPGAVEPPPTTGQKSGFDQARPFLAIGFGVIAVGGFAMGIIETVVANGKSQDADDLLAEIGAAGQKCPGATQCADLDASLSDQSSAENLAKVGYIVGGVGLVGVATVLLWPKAAQARPQRGAVSVVPLTPRRGGGLALRGAF